MNNSPDFFSDMDTPVQVDFFSDIPQEKPASTAQNIASSAPVQFGLGVAKAATYPADLMKMFGKAELLQELEDLEERGIPIDRKKYLKGMEEALNLYPTQELAEKGIEKATGISLEPKS